MKSLKKPFQKVSTKTHSKQLKLAGLAKSVPTEHPPRPMTAMRTVEMEKRKAPTSHFQWKCNRVSRVQAYMV